MFIEKTNNLKRSRQKKVFVAIAFCILFILMSSVAMIFTVIGLWVEKSEMIKHSNNLSESHTK